MPDSAGIAEITALALPLAALASHPDNPREVVGDVSELAASIAAHGVLEPLVVVTAAAWLAGAPGRDRAELDRTDATHVVIAGHRRAAAAGAAGVDRVPVVVRDDLAGDGADLEVMLAENVQRADLSPLEEAVGFDRLRAAGRSQRAIAAAVGCSQAHVSKRLGLLRLPDTAREALADGTISVADAERLGVLADHPDRIRRVVAEHADDPRWSVAEHIDAERRDLVVDAKAAATRTALAAEGLDVVDDPAKRWPGDYWRRRCHDDDQVAAARAAGTLAGAINPHTGAPVYYTTADLPDEPARADWQEHEAERKRGERERARAMRARAEVCAAIVAAGPGPIPRPQPGADLVDQLARHTIDRAGADVRSLAWAWAHPDQTPATGRSAHHTWERTLQAGTGPAARRARIIAAWTIALAADEEHARWTHTPWADRDVAHLDRLTAAGYQPTDWETQRLDAARESDDDEIARFVAGLPAAYTHPDATPETT